MATPLFRAALAALLVTVGTAYNMTMDEIKQFSVAHNTYRCMHGVDMVPWDLCVAASAENWAEREKFEHSNSYDLPPCEGPAAENLAKYYATPTTAVAGWYSEKDKYFTNGDEKGAGKFVKEAGHFTIIVWKGMTSFGCGKKDTLFVCRYKGGDTLTTDTPNMEGGFEENVLAAKNDEAGCRVKAEGYFAETGTTTNTTQSAAPMLSTPSMIATASAVVVPLLFATGLH
uniref:SCP domain-containing protein n=1 Tax=Chromera velia CCMP2878 TaxID=1169474 RepID=A0A0G4EZ18_9ALVE|eukprot:Cvel_2548.t1-p1 / transcript=Cvel_2548.t1 / gene=Cvel_2548 / organism=Chromera_velia_CCMP2878 / gene_product=Protein PRY2, putative / transcript_product=Protein PRY2, putative / location=Cvel_scaffold100:114141-114824(-) / protein_length=228 / sequence_SO=supercontig / SO=protein_coding / is_pseudo=false